MTKLTTGVVHSSDPNLNIMPVRASDITQWNGNNPVQSDDIDECRYDWRTNQFRAPWFFPQANDRVQFVLGRLNRLHKYFAFTFNLEITFQEVTLFDSPQPDSDDMAILDERYSFDSVEDYDLGHFYEARELDGLIPVPRRAANGGWGFVNAYTVATTQIVEISFRSQDGEFYLDGARLQNPLQATFKLLSGITVSLPDLSDRLSFGYFTFGIRDVYGDGLCRLVPDSVATTNFHYWVDPIIFYEIQPRPFEGIPGYIEGDLFDTYAHKSPKHGRVTNPLTN